MGKLILNIEPETLNKFDTGELDIEDFLREVLLSRSVHTGNSQGRVCSELNSYHYGDGGAPSVTDFDISCVGFDPESESGGFDIEYTVYYYYGCDNMNSDCEVEQAWSFHLDRHNNTLDFVTEEKVVRDTFEEF